MDDKSINTTDNRSLDTGSKLVRILVVEDSEQEAAALLEQVLLPAGIPAELRLPAEGCACFAVKAGQELPVLRALHRAIWE